MAFNTDVIAFIFARGGSKGLPGKNIRPFLGKPLIGFAIEQALGIERIRRVIVSTDSEEIAKVARDFGAETPFLRPSALAEDDSPEWQSWQHALSFIQEDEQRLPRAMVSIPVTAPLRLPIDINNCLDLYDKGGSDVVITVSDSYRNPYFNMIKPYPDGTVGLVVEGEGRIFRRQDAPDVFDMTTVAYVADPYFVMNNYGIFSGRVRAVHIPVERSIDIDTLLDFEIAEFLFNKGK